MQVTGSDVLTSTFHHPVVVLPLSWQPRSQVTFTNAMTLPAFAADSMAEYHSVHQPSLLEAHASAGNLSATHCTHYIVKHACISYRALRLTGDLNHKPRKQCPTLFLVSFLFLSHSYSHATNKTTSSLQGRPAAAPGEKIQATYPFL